MRPADVYCILIGVIFAVRLTSFAGAFGMPSGLSFALHGMTSAFLLALLVDNRKGRADR